MVAGGRADRFGGDVPKQYLDLLGRPVLAWSVSRFAEHPSVDRVVVVLPADDARGNRGESVRAWPGVSAVVAGGPERPDSVRAGLLAAGDARWVLVHDAVRPAVSDELIERVLEETRRSGAAVPGVAVADTLKRRGRDGRVSGTVDREPWVAAQTPQGARVDWLREALDRARERGLDVTDEAAALEAVGRPVALVDGDPANVKITVPVDLDVLRARLGGDAMDMRVGHGFDVHRFADSGRTLVLGGVEFPGVVGLEGHSDADVVLHAAMDALLGAAGLPDIGVRFPPGDPRWRGASSVDLAARVARAVAEAGWRPVNLDITVLAERPRIADRAAAMKASTAAALGLDPAAVGLKATTLEGLGALGRGDGIACEAVALVRRGA